MKTNLSIMTLAATVAASSALAQEATPTETVLDRVVISAGKEKIAINTPQSVSVVDQEDIDADQPTTVGDVLTDLPGVKAVGSDRVLGESFNIRGIGSLASSDENRMIVQIDGATKTYEQYRMGSLFTDPDMYKQIEVLRGPASSTLYGSGALAGVINLTTKDASDFLRGDDTFAFREKLEFNSNRGGFLTSSTVASEPVKNLELLGSLIYRRSDQFKDGNGDLVSGSAFDAPSGLVKAKYTFGENEDHEVKASYQHWTTKSTGKDYSQTGTQSGFGTIDREVVDQTAVLGYKYTPIDNKLIDLDVTFSYTNSEVDQSNSSRTSSSSQIYDPITYAYENWQLRAQNTMETAGDAYKNYFITGVETFFQTRTADKTPGNTSSTGVTSHPGGESLRTGLYVQNEWVYRDKLTIIPGIRVDYQTLKPGSAVTVSKEEVSATGISPKLAAHYKLTNNWGVFGSLSYTERLPVIDEIYDNNSSNLNLDSESSINYEGGLSFSAKDVLQTQDAISAKGTVFVNEVDNLIERISTSSTFYNAGESTIKGIELEGSYNSKHLFSRAAYSIIRGEDKGTGAALNSIPADELALTIGGRLPENHLEFGWRGVFAKEQVLVDSTNNSGTNTRSGGYVVHDLFASWKPEEGAVGGTEFRFGISNLFDRRYQEHLAGDVAKGRSVKLTLARQF